jgi:hypothetical protein
MRTQDTVHGDLEEVVCSKDVKIKVCMVIILIYLGMCKHTFSFNPDS